MGVIQSITDFVADLLGCEEGDTACESRAKKWATWTVLLSVLAVIIFFAPRIYHWYKGGKK